MKNKIKYNKMEMRPILVNGFGLGSIFNMGLVSNC